MGELTERIRSLILSLQISSASPGHINEILQLDQSIDLDDIIEKNNTQSGGVNSKKKPVGKNKDLQSLIGGTSSQADNVVNLAKNPTNMISGLMGSLAKTAPFIGAVIAVLSLPKVIKKVGDFLTAPGSPFDRRLKIISSEAQNAFISRQEQRNLQIGKRQVIFTSNKGFRNSGGALTGNSFKNLGTGQLTAGLDIGTTRTASILDKAEGL